MPYRIEHVESEGGLIISWKGQVRGREVIRSCEDRFAPPERLKRLRYIITDCTGAVDFTMTIEDIKRIARISNAVAPLNRHLFAVGVMPTSIGYGLARMFQAYADDDETGWHTHVTRSRPEAEDWLRANLDDGLTFGHPLPR